jgi:simple sugar transport system ATP-binding protein
VTTVTTDADVLLRVRGVTKSYAHVQALRGVDLDVAPGAVIGLVGDNGAGKSTLVKILSGTERPDGGTIELAGEDVRFETPLEARRHGVETVYQDLALAPELDAADNFFLGRELRRGGLLGALGWRDTKRMRAETAAAFERLNVRIKDQREPVSTYSGGQRQSVAVARAVNWADRLLMLDEPTAALGVPQTRQVLDLIRRVRDLGVAVILISHNMPDVLAVCDRVSVLRLGRRVLDAPTADITGDDLVAAMTGTAELASTSGDVR